MSIPPDQRQRAADGYRHFLLPAAKEASEDGICGYRLRPYRQCRDGSAAPVRQTQRVLRLLETDRLVLRPIALHDVELLVELDSDPQVTRYITGRQSTPQEVLARIRERLGSRWVAFDRPTGAFVGWFELVPAGEDTYDAGYRLRRQWWGQGLATEGIRALIDSAFSQLGARRITAHTMAVNARSRAVMERCGMRYVRTFHLEWDRPLPGTEEGEVEYELTVDRWRPGSG